MKRSFVYLSALVGIGGAVYLAGALQAQGQPPAGGAPPAAKPTGRVAVFNVARVMKDFQKWQYFAKVMNDKRTGAAAELGKLRNEIATLQDAIQKEPLQAKKDELTRTLVDKQRQFEDRERGIRKVLDEESAAHLKTLFAEIQACVKACVDTNGYDLVLAYPDATTVEETNSPLYYDLKLRPPAAMPFYVAPSADMTEILIATLNKHFQPPASVTPAGGAAPMGTPPGAPPVRMP